jgi:hypothetical protein
MRVSVAVMATNRLSVRMVGRWPSTVKPITSSTSDGLTRPIAGLTQRADQHHRHHDGDQHHQGGAEAAAQLLAQGGIE